MFTIERSMNTIWRVPAHRNPMNALLLYWAILSFTPLLLGLSFAATSYLVSCSLFLNHPVPPLLFNLAPCLFSLIGFTFLYMIAPNHPVKLQHAIIGGLFATVLFESVKQGFAYYLIHYNFYQLLYGAFATIPIFFIWVYWVWLITLLGAEISYALSVKLPRLKPSTQPRKNNANNHRGDQINEYRQKKRQQ